ncbi:MAG: sodium:proton exchanger, partial [Deltaproteobacteria bacterium]
SLQLGELREGGRVVWRLVTVGAVVSWLGGAVVARWASGLTTELAVLLGAVLVVTGPTVLVPLLRQLRLRPNLASILKWEGILIDPLGVILAVLVLEGIVEESRHAVGTAAMTGLGASLAIGILLGAAGAGFLVAVVARHRIPDFLHNPVVLATVGTVLAAGNMARAESGLLAVTVMGMALAWQRKIPIQGILEFKESLRTLFISTLFIVLAARIDLSELASQVRPSLWLLAALVLVVRPLSVLVATIGTKLAWRERALLMLVAPRGIVAAAVASVLALRLTDAGFPGADALVPLSFSVIGGTILVYSITAPIAARVLGLSGSEPEGVLLLGAHGWARSIARALVDAGASVRLADRNYTNVRTARMDGLEARYCDFLDERIAERLDLEGIGKCLALTPNDQANALAALHFSRFFDRSQVYQLAPEGGRAALASAELPRDLRGRILFADGLTFSEITRRVARGAIVKATPLSEEFDWTAYTERYGPDAVPMFLVGQQGRVQVFATDHPPRPTAGQTVVALVPPDDSRRSDT